MAGPRAGGVRDGDEGAPPSDPDAPPRVLIVEDEPDLAELYADWLGEAYAVRTAHGGEEALAAVDEHVDVALVDRRMPDMSGDEVVEAIRQRGFESRVAMVTAVEPDFDVLELGFDDYLRKPVSAPDLLETVERLVTLAAYDREIQTYYAMLSKQAALESEKPPDELAASDEYAALVDRIERQQTRIDAELDRFSEQEHEAVFRALGARGQGD